MHGSRGFGLAACLIALWAAAPDAAAQERGVLVHGADEEPLTLDPAQVEAGGGGEMVIYQVYDRLLDVGPDGPALIPSLATEVPSLENGLVSADGLAYTFPLREGVTFHDGSAFTAADVKYAWDRVMTMDLPEGNASVMTEAIAATEVVDPYTFRVTLHEPSASFLYSVVLNMAASIASPTAVEANGGIVAGEPNRWMQTNMVGTGPYRFVAWNRTEDIQLAVFEGYWGEPARLDLRLEMGADADVRVLGLRAGEFDTIETDPTFIADLEGVEGVTLYTEGLLLEPLHIGFNLNLEEASLPDGDTIPADFFHDPRIRRAFNHAFDYAAFLNGPLAGFGAINPHYVPIGLFGHDPEAPVYDRQDAAAAEALFREAGVWDEGFAVTIVAEAGSLFAIQALVLKDSLERLNPKFRVDVAGVAEAVFDEELAQSPIRYAMWAKNADPAGDPHPYLQAYAHPDGDWGEAHGFRNGYADPDTIARLIDEGAVELDPARRAEIYAELQRLLHADPMWLIGAQEGSVTAYRSDLQGFALNPLWPRPSIRFALIGR